MLNRLIWNVFFAEFLKHSSCLKTCSDDYKQCATNYNNALLQVQLQDTVANNHTSNLVCWWVKWHTPTAIDTDRLLSILAARSVNTWTVPSPWCWKSVAPRLRSSPVHLCTRWPSQWSKSIAITRPRIMNATLRTGERSLDNETLSYRVESWCGFWCFVSWCCCTNT